MPPTVRKLNIVVSAACGNAARQVSRRLPSMRIQAEVCSMPTADIQAQLAERPVDAVILSAEDFDLAADIAERSYTGVLLLADAECLKSMEAACIAAGVLMAQPDDLETALPQLLALCTRLRSLRERTNTLRRKLDDTRLVSRAKLLLMSRFKMSESEAHRYIEKTAMDTGAKRREVAESIIRTYEE